MLALFLKQYENLYKNFYECLSWCVLYTSITYNQPIVYFLTCTPSQLPENKKIDRILLVMQQNQFTTEFMTQVSRFIVLFGGFWVLFTFVMLLIFESGNFSQNPTQTLVTFFGLFFVARVFWNFYRDTKTKANDPDFKIINNWATFGIDSATLLILTIYQFVSVFSKPEFTITNFNDLSTLFLGCIFQFFRFIYHFLFD